MRNSHKDFPFCLFYCSAFSLSHSQWASPTQERGLWGTLRQTCLGLKSGTKSDLQRGWLYKLHSSDLTLRLLSPVETGYLPLTGPFRLVLGLHTGHCCLLMTLFLFHRKLAVHFYLPYSISLSSHEARVLRQKVVTERMTPQQGED